MHTSREGHILESPGSSSFSSSALPQWLLLLSPHHQFSYNHLLFPYVVLQLSGQQQEIMEHNFIDHIRHEGHEEEEWGTWKEVAFWAIALAANLGFIVYAAWRLAVRHTDATGTPVVVRVKVPDDHAAAHSTAVQSEARRRGGKQSLPQ